MSCLLAFFSPRTRLAICSHSVANILKTVQGNSKQRTGDATLIFEFRFVEAINLRFSTCYNYFDFEVDKMYLEIIAFMI